MKIINTDKAPEAIGPYSQGYIINNLVYSSGQLPVSGEILNTIAEQAEQSCINVSEILKEAGMDFERVFKTTCFLSDMEYFKEFNEVYERVFISKPARRCVGVKELPKGVLCEIEVIAMLPQ